MFSYAAATRRGSARLHISSATWRALKFLRSPRPSVIIIIIMARRQLASAGTVHMDPQQQQRRRRRAMTSPVSTRSRWYFAASVPLRKLVVVVPSNSFTFGSWCCQLLAAMTSSVDLQGPQHGPCSARVENCKWQFCRRFFRQCRIGWAGVIVLPSAGAALRLQPLACAASALIRRGAPILRHCDMTLPVPSSLLVRSFLCAFPHVDTLYSRTMPLSPAVSLCVLFRPRAVSGCLRLCAKLSRHSRDVYSHVSRCCGDSRLANPISPQFSASFRR